MDNANYVPEGSDKFFERDKKKELTKDEKRDIYKSWAKAGFWSEDFIGEEEDGLQ